MRYVGSVKSDHNPKKMSADDDSIAGRLNALQRAMDVLKAGSGADMERGHERPWAPRRTLCEVQDVMDDNSPPAYGMKIVLLGRAGVGKTSWLRQLCTGRFNAADATVTMGVDFFSRQCWVSGQKFAVSLWDTAGLERVTPSALAMMPSYLRGANGVVVMLDITDRASLTTADELLGTIGRQLDAAQTSVLLVGNKCDRAPTRVITDQEGGRLASRHGAWYLETSALHLSSVKFPLHFMLSEMVKMGRFQPTGERGPGAPTAPPRPVRLRAPTLAASGGSGCSC